MGDQRGVYRKFDVVRTDGESRPGGKHDGCRYFVLDMDHDQFAPAAIAAYADACEEALPALALDLRRWLAGVVPEGLRPLTPVEPGGGEAGEGPKGIYCEALGGMCTWPFCPACDLNKAPPAETRAGEEGS